MRLLAASLLGLCVLGCTTDPGLAPPPTHGDAGPPLGDASLPMGEPTYYGVVDDLLAEHCLGCHSAAGGGIAPFDLDTYETASVAAGAMARATAARIMPPFYANNDGTCQTFEDHGRWLTDEEIAILDTWNRNGHPMGDPNSTPPMTMSSPVIDAPDVTIQVPAPFTPQPIGNDPNEIRCFVVDTGVTADAFITSYEVRPGAPAVVHHVIVYEPESDADATQAAGMQSTDGRAGYVCPGGPVVPAHPVALWAPGGHRTDYPTDTGLALPAARRLIIQIHYNLSSVMTAMTPTPADQTSIRFITTASVTRPAQMLLLSQNSLTLPPHQQTVMSDPRTMSAPGAGTIWGIFPHMHTLGTGVNVTVTHAGASTCAIDLGHWDFGWQQGYFYDTAHPLQISARDRITIQCQYDTMSATDTTIFGEGTENEMCLAFFYVTSS